MGIKNDAIRAHVRKTYSNIATSGTANCSCCGEDVVNFDKIKETASKIGYSENELKKVPEGSNLNLGCGNPTAIASLKEGETVLDLGSGGGFDCFLARERVGASGIVVGVDMTPEMISLARKNADESEYDNVDFRLGEIEHLPVADNSVDIVISNCVINLSPDKPQVFKDVYRTLKSNGRICIADIVTTAVLPESVQEDLDLYSSCVSGASLLSEVEEMLKLVGFKEIKITPKDNGKKMIEEWIPENNVSDYVMSVIIEAHK